MQVVLIGRSQQVVALLGRPLHFDGELVVVANRAVAKTRDNVGIRGLVSNEFRIDPVEGLRKTKRTSTDWIGFGQSSVPQRKVFTTPP